MALQTSSLLRQLTAFSHRGVGSSSNTKTATLIAETLQKIGFTVEKQAFQTPATYVPIIYWLIGVLAIGLLSVQWWGIVSVLLVAIAAVNGVLYFDWRPSWLLYAPPLVRAENVIGRYGKKANGQKVILMAHFDSAPVSFLYRRQTKDGFRNSIRATMILMALAVPVVGLSYHLPQNQYLLVIRVLLVTYFLGQAILGTVGFWQKGFTNGASDNATGVVAALAAAEKLKALLKDTEIEVVLTNAEEAGMIGAYHYFQKKFDKSRQNYLINFDTLGNGQLNVITKTGSLSLIEYNNDLTKAALALIETQPQFKEIAVGDWHTADFDSAWFVRAGIHCMTLSALDAEGTMPNIHRPEDTIDHVDEAPMHQAIDFAVAIAQKISQ